MNEIAVSDERLPVTPSVTTWARNRAGFTTDDARKYFPRIRDWEEGTAAPTYAQLEAMAEKFKVPVAVFFFPAPPETESIAQSFRTLPEHYFDQLPRTVKALVRKGQAMQLNLGELGDEKNPATRLLTADLRVTWTKGVQDACSGVREYLGITIEQQISWDSTDEALENWRDALARVGIFAFKDAFHADGYFGFCLYDDVLPIIYVNNSTTKTRQIFTLFHELAHLLFCTSGIDVADQSYIDRLGVENKDVEILCNRFAAEFLVPDAVFDSLVAKANATQEHAAKIADQLKVSREVIYRKMLDRGWVSQAEYQAATSAWARQKKAQSDGGNYYYTQIAYLGNAYIELALKRYHQGRFDGAQLAGYLNIKPKSLESFEHMYSSRK